MGTDYQKRSRYQSKWVGVILITNNTIQYVLIFMIIILNIMITIILMIILNIMNIMMLILNILTMAILSPLQSTFSARGAVAGKPQRVARTTSADLPRRTVMNTIAIAIKIRIRIRITTTITITITGDESFEDVSDPRGCFHRFLDSVHDHGHLVIETFQFC